MLIKQGLEAEYQQFLEVNSKVWIQFFRCAVYGTLG